MKKFYLGMLLVALASLQAKPTAAPAPKNRVIARREKRSTERLKKVYQEVSEEFGPIIEAYKKVEAAKPAEYSFYLTKLKSEVMKAIEENKLGLYKSTWKRTMLQLAQPLNERISHQENPIAQFRTYILPKTLSNLGYNKKYVTDKELAKKADVLLNQLKEINRILS